MSAFTQYSKYYDLFYLNKDYKKEALYIYDVISRFSKKSRNLLNLGCGTGNHDLPLIEKGLKITSVDASAHSLKIAEAKRKEHEVPEQKLKYVRCDIRQLRLNKRYDNAIALFHVINYLNTNKDLIDCFNAVNRSLESKGLFVFDSWYGPAVLNDLPHVRIKKVKHAGVTITRKATPALYPNKNIAKINFDFKLQSGKEKKEFSEVHAMRYLFYPEVELLLKLANFELIHAEEWLTGRPVGSDSWYVLFVARKR